MGELVAIKWIGKQPALLEMRGQILNRSQMSLGQVRVRRNLLEEIEHISLILDSWRSHSGHLQGKCHISMEHALQFMSDCLFEKIK